jgi:ABC-2 type transport system ATP-binding protein
MSEMALTAQHLIVIGRGKLLADESIERMIAAAGSSVRVRSPQQAELGRVLEDDGATTRSDDGALLVTGLDAAGIGDLAAAHRITLHELSPQRASLEEAFFELTEHSTEYQGADITSTPATREVLR